MLIFFFITGHNYKPGKRSIPQNIKQRAKQILIPVCSAAILIGAYIGQKKLFENPPFGGEKLTIRELEYISSAGLRVILRMTKHVGQGNLTMDKPTELVLSILEQTGFSDMLGL